MAELAVFCRALPVADEAKAKKAQRSEKQRHLLPDGFSGTARVTREARLT